MNSYYKKKTKLFMFLAYGCYLVGVPMIFIGLESVSFFNILGASLFMVGYIFLIIGSTYWSVGKGYGKSRGIFIGFFINLLSPIVLALHRDESHLVTYTGKKSPKEASQKKINKCASCDKYVLRYSGPSIGMWSGNIHELASIQKIEAENAYECTGCHAIVCPVCLGRKASEMGVRMFVCTQCGHKPVTTIYR